MNRKTVYTLVGLLVVTLAVLGVGYALWFEDLKIHGEVTTGELDVQFSLYPAVEWFSDENNVEITDVPDSKWGSVDCESWFVAYYDLEDSPEGSTVSDDGFEVIKFEAIGMYPSYHCLLKFDITNTGSVPVHFYGEIPDGDQAIEDLIVDDLSCVRRDGGQMDCTLTQGYWGQHTKYDKHTDPTWNGLEDTQFGSSGMTYYEILMAPAGGDPYIILAHQYIAAKLNLLHGASMPGYVQVVYDAATNFFFNDGPFPAGPYPDVDTPTNYYSASEMLDRYNNGLEGPAHCDVIDEDGPGTGDELPITEFQLHQNETIDCFLELHFTNDDLIEENEDYSFQYHIRAYQWNEDTEGTSRLFPEWYNGLSFPKELLVQP